MSTFFKELKATGITNFNLEVKFEDDDKVVIILLPKTTAKDAAMQNIKPLVLRGPIQDVDREFFNSINTPLQEVAALFTNVVSFEESKQKAEADSVVKKSKKDAEKKQEEEKKSKLEKAFKQLEAITSSEGYDAKKEKAKVLKALDNIFLIDADNKKAQDFKTEFIKEVSEVSLFDANEIDNI